jgi:mono/diheme cytochrome c family protein
MPKHILIGLIAVLVAGIGGFAAFSWQPSIAPIERQSTFTPELIARGEVLGGTGYCATCHTAKGGKPYAGGYPMRTQFGTVYSTNITPGDRDRRVVRGGIPPRHA